MAEIIKEKVDSASLEIGMYVCELDRPWSETTFPLQGFYIKTNEDIDMLVKNCKHVFIDASLSQAGKPKSHTVEERKAAIQRDLGKPLNPYQDSTKWQAEFPKAKAAVQQLSESVKQVFANFHKTQSLDINKVRNSVEPMIESVSRNPDACIWLARMKNEDHYIYEHSVSSSIWAVALGRQIGLDKDDLRSLALGALLFDIGKLSLNQEMLRQERKLTAEEFKEVQKHVNHSLELVEGLKDLNRNIISMIEQHHERFDGSGYPKGMRGDEIHIFARIAAIADCYDAITSDRYYARGISPTEAIKNLYQWRNIDFQAELVEEFIQAIGIYPAGSLVELSSGEVAIVLAEYRTRRLKPEVLVILDANKNPVKNTYKLKLYEQEADEDGKVLNIISSLEPKAYGIDMQSLQI